MIPPGSIIGWTTVMHAATSTTTTTSEVMTKVSVKVGDRARRAGLRKDAQARRRAAGHREHTPQQRDA